MNPTSTPAVGTPRPSASPAAARPAMAGTADRGVTSVIVTAPCLIGKLLSGYDSAVFTSHQ